MDPKKNNNDSIVLNDAAKTLNIKNDNILDMTLLSSFSKVLRSTKDNKETLKLVFDLLNSQVKEDEAKDKNVAIDSIKGIAELALQKSTAFNDDKLKRRGLNTIKIAVKNVNENLDKKVAIIVCPTKKQEDLSFAAENSHGIVQVLLEKRNRAMSRGDMNADAEATTLLTNFLNEIDTASIKLKTMIEDAFAKGHGTFVQLSSYTRRVVEDNKKEIKDLLLAGKSIDEIAEKFKLSQKSLSLTIAKDIKRSIINSFKSIILEKRESGTATEDILKELNLHTSFVSVPELNSKIKEWKKNNTPIKKEVKKVEINAQNTTKEEISSKIKEEEKEVKKVS